MNDSESLRDEYLSLRDRAVGAQIATLSADGLPSASHAPIVWQASAAYLFLSDLAEHSRNLRANPAIGLVMLDEAQSAGNAFARRRITVQGSIEKVDRESDEFNRLMPVFHQRFGDVMTLIEPLADFNLFKVLPDSGRYIRGFGQAYEISGADFDQLAHVDPRR